MEWIEKASQAAVLAVFRALSRDLGEAIMGLLERLLMTPLGLLADLDLLELLGYTRHLAWLILPVVLIKHGIHIAHDRAEGAATESTETFVRGAVLAAAAVASTTAITAWIMRFADSIIQSFLGASSGITPMRIILGIPDGSGFALVLLVLILIIAFIVLLVQRAILNATLALNLAIGPLAATSIAWPGDSTLWNTWLRETVSVVATFVLQTVLLWWLLRKIGSWGTDTFESKLLCLGIVVVMLKSPGIIRQWTYSAGGGSAVLAGGATAGRMAVTYYMLRALPGAIFRR